MAGKKPVLLLFGPTASGKTAFLQELFTGSSSIPAEVISADSMQVYRGLDIGTAKPSASFLAELPHHLINIRDPKEQFNVGDFVRLAQEHCQDILQRGLLPVISGGTAFYLKAFCQGLPAAPQSQAGIREAVQADYLARGAELLYQELCQVDAVSAARIHPNDHYRIKRALEVYRSTGRPLSAFNPAEEGAVWAGERAYRILAIELVRERKVLYQRIDQRAAQMFEQGLTEELIGLVARGYTSGDPGMKAIGYREFFDEDGTFLNPQGNGDLSTYIRQLIARNSRRYAKRQITFFSSLENRLSLHIERGRTQEGIQKLRGSIEEFLALDALN